MSDVAAPVVELRLLTHQPEEMVEWWAALLGGAPQPLSSRMTTVTGRCLRVVIERSYIALAYHPEASGVTAISLTVGDVATLDVTLNRLARCGSGPERVTCKAGVTAFWLRDPNGTDVTVCLPLSAARPYAETDSITDELDVSAVLAHIGIANSETTTTDVTD